MVRMTALDIQVSLHHSDGHVGRQHDVSENALLAWKGGGGGGKMYITFFFIKNGLQQDFATFKCE